MESVKFGLRENFEKAIRLETDAGRSALPHTNLANALYALGVDDHSSAEIERSVAEFRMAINVNPGYALAHENLGAVLRAQGKVKEAEREESAGKELRLHPGGCAAARPQRITQP
jgi:tetratricopeptide (TPR) repeat protein